MFTDVYLAEMKLTKAVDMAVFKEKIIKAFGSFQGKDKRQTKTTLTQVKNIVKGLNNIGRVEKRVARRKEKEINHEVISRSGGP